MILTVFYFYAGIALREAKEISERQKARNDLMRKIQYDRYLETRNLDIFNLPGLEFHTFRHLKIKFSFYPRAITRYVNEKVRFYISLKYWFKYWLVKRDSLPANYKWRIYSLFYSENNFAVSDDNIISVIVKIYKILINWCKEQEEFRLDKYEVSINKKNILKIHYSRDTEEKNVKTLI